MDHGGHSRFQNARAAALFRATPRRNTDGPHLVSKAKREVGRQFVSEDRRPSTDATNHLATTPQTQSGRSVLWPQTQSGRSVLWPRTRLNCGSSRGTIRTMTPRPGFICVMVNDMARSLTFYRHLGFKFPPEAYGEIHVELELPGGLQIYWQNAEFAKLYAPDYRPAPHGMVTLGFQVDSAREVMRWSPSSRGSATRRIARRGRPPGAPATRTSTTPTASSSRSTTLSLEIEDAPGEGAHGDAGAGGAGWSAGRRRCAPPVALRSRYAPVRCPSNERSQRL